jgi:hypothetical protein
MSDPVTVLERWLTWLDSHDGRIYRRSHGGQETDLDLVATIPNPPGSAILTVGDLRVIVTRLRRAMKEKNHDTSRMAGV